MENYTFETKPNERLIEWNGQRRKKKLNENCGAQKDHTRYDPAWTAGKRIFFIKLVQSIAIDKSKWSDASNFIVIIYFRNCWLHFNK